MADWLTTDTIYLADAVGNPRPAQVGVVRINKRTVFGIRHNPDQPRDGDLPDYTVDLEGLSDVITTLNEQRRALLKAGGTL
ncbi:hypothetical protein [Kibdelosporangium phytohabitans]|uniref:Uncharacterized protein n=1 Tax=Kibdelosporangium phytohabitans TaxID=860235 RepID=A0A0N9HV99_9PSEU|nr:hypothetical protein [Kibdelosporangium phytohabitans]ALG06868.1 hypothetical protein AOZ06_07915 [Kibdelosporangium phytohabitans]MBE1468118.1 hypothetical protein [Kibdelosporangium phytohabitans]